MSPQPTPPPIWWSDQGQYAVWEFADGVVNVLAKSRQIAGLPADAVRLVAEAKQCSCEDAERTYRELEQELERVAAAHTVEREAHEAWRARVTAERDELRAELASDEAELARLAHELEERTVQRDIAEGELAGYDPDGLKYLMNEAVTFCRQRAVVVAYLDECDNGMGSVQGDEVRRRLGVTTDAD